MRRRPTLLVLAATILMLGVAGVAVPQSQAHAVPRCHGKPATIVWKPGDWWIVKGTSGDDVIFTGRGRQSVSGQGGNDTICTGGGDDAVSVNGTSWVDLGAGNDFMQAGRCTCVVRGGPGRDWIDLRWSSHGRALGGPGRDGIAIAVRPWIRGQSYVGGPGRDEILTQVAHPRGGHPYPRFVLDLARGWYDAGGERVSTQGFESAAVVGNGSVPRADLYVVRGTDGDNRLTVFLGTRTGLYPPAVIRGRAGDDELEGSRGDDLLDGGPGIDLGVGERGTDTCLSIEGPLDPAAPTCEISH